MLAEQLDMEIENIGQLIQGDQLLKLKIQKEAENLNFLEKEHRLE